MASIYQFLATIPKVRQTASIDLIDNQASDELGMKISGLLGHLLSIYADGDYLLRPGRV